MGYVQKLETGHRARWREPGGSLRSKSFTRLRDAEQFLRTQETAVDRGAYIDAQAGRITFAEWAEHYFALAGKRLARTSHERDIDYLNNHVLPRWRSTPLNRITKPAVERWVVELAEPGRRASGEGPWHRAPSRRFPRRSARSWPPRSTMTAFRSSLVRPALPWPG